MAYGSYDHQGKVCYGETKLSKEWHIHIGGSSLQGSLPCNLDERPKWPLFALGEGCRENNTCLQIKHLKVKKGKFAMFKLLLCDAHGSSELLKEKSSANLRINLNLAYPQIHCQFDIQTVCCSVRGCHL